MQFLTYSHESESHSVASDSLWPHGLYSPWDSPGQNAGVDNKAQINTLRDSFIHKGEVCRIVFNIEGV